MHFKRKSEDRLWTGLSHHVIFDLNKKHIYKYPEKENKTIWAKIHPLMKHLDKIIPHISAASYTKRQRQAEPANLRVVQKV